MTDKKYCLIDEKWIPVVGKGNVSLLDVFTDDSCRDINGNAIQKIALIKLFIAIAQAAVQLKDRAEWEQVKAKGLALKVCKYMESRRDCFYLFGDKPFLQMPVLRNINGVKTSKIYYDYLPDLASENDSILKESQAEHSLSDAEKAVFIVQLMNYSLGSKRTSFIEPLSKNYSLKTKSAKAGPSIGGSDGYLQTCFMGESIIETVWMNYFTTEDIKSVNPEMALNVSAPWEEMPEGEDDEIARRLKNSVYAWLIGLSRFVLLEEDGIKYVEGLQYQTSVKAGYFEPFITINLREGKVLYSNTRIKPWRSLQAILQVAFDNTSSDFVCAVIKLFFDRIKNNTTEFRIWSGGLKARFTIGEQSVKQNDDYVESEITLDSSVDGVFFKYLCDSMVSLNAIAESLRKAIRNYQSSLKMQTENTGAAVYAFWTEAEKQFTDILDSCYDSTPERREEINSILVRKALKIYDRYCSHDSARQMLVWTKFRKISARRRNEKQ